MSVGVPLGKDVDPNVRKNLEQLTDYANGRSSSALMGKNYRWTEGSYPNASSPVCGLLQFKQGTSWQTIGAWNAVGVNVFSPPQLTNFSGVLTTQANWTLTTVRLHKSWDGLVTFSGIATSAAGAGLAVANFNTAGWAPFNGWAGCHIVNATGGTIANAGVFVNATGIGASGITLATPVVITVSWRVGL